MVFEHGKYFAITSDIYSHNQLLRKHWFYKRIHFLFLNPKFLCRFRWQFNRFWKSRMSMFLWLNHILLNFSSSCFLFSVVSFVSISWHFLFLLRPIWLSFTQSCIKFHNLIRNTYKLLIYLKWFLVLWLIISVVGLLQ